MYYLSKIIKFTSAIAALIIPMLYRKLKVVDSFLLVVEIVVNVHTIREYK